jgi:tetratricopeptide (TPR) repeat protein
MRRLLKTIPVFFTIAFTVLAQDPQDLLTSGMADLQMKRYREAVAEFTRFLELEKSENLSAYLGRAEAYLRLSEWERAIADFEKAEQIAPGSGNLGLARTHAQMGNAKESVYYLEKHLKSEQRVPEKKILLDKAFESVENSSEWRALWRKDWYTTGEQVIRDVEYLMGKESNKEALSILDEQIRQDPENPVFYHLRAKIFTSQQEYKQALTNCDLALRYQKDNQEYLVTKSAILVGMRKYDEALKSLNRAIYLNPTQLDLYPERALVHEKAGNLTDALQDIDHYLKFIDNDKTALLLAGQLNQKIGKLYPALERFNKLIELDQSNPVYFISRGKAYLEAGTYRYAISDFGMALDLDPSNDDTYLNRGKAYLAIDDLDHACYDFREAAEKGNKEAAELFYKYCQ